ncbi:MAG: MptD family putative ECF transporter S component [Acutalibacteraceae bacterium]
MSNQNNKLQGKDLINVGIYTAIYFFVTFLVAMLGFIPIFMVLMAVIAPIIGGIPFMLFLTKVKKTGMIFLMSVIMGLMMLLTGMGYWPLIISIISGIATELIYRAGKYKSAKCAVLASGVFPLWMWGNYIPLFVNAEKYFSSRQSFGQEYVDSLTSMLPGWMCPVLLIACFVSGIIGGLIGKVMLKKHFKKAGIA